MGDSDNALSFNKDVVYRFQNEKENQLQEI